MAQDTRLNRIMPGLSARERAVAAIAAWKEGQEEAPWLRRALPPGQVSEFAHLIDLARGVNGRLAWLILVYQEQVRGHWLLLGWIGALKAWGHNASALSHAFLGQHVELLTESEAAERRSAARAEVLSIREAAEYLAARTAAEAELDDDETGAAVRVQEQRLRRAARTGELKVVRGRITLGVLWDWLEEETRLWPEWGSRVSVVGDDRADDVARQRDWSQSTRKALEAAPTAFAEGWEVGEDSSQSNHTGSSLVNVLKARTARSWRDARALSLCIDEVAERLGDDPMHPELRAGLDALAADVEALAAAVDELFGRVERQEPGDGDLTPLRAAINET